MDLDCYPELAAVIACHSLLVEDRAGQEWEASVGDLVKAGLSISAYVDAGTLDGSALLLVEEGGQLLSSTLAEVVTAGFNPAEFGPQSRLDADSETLLLSQGGEVGRTALRDLGRFMPAFGCSLTGAQKRRAEAHQSRAECHARDAHASGRYLLDLEVALPSADPCLFTTLGSSRAAVIAAGSATSLQASAVTRQQIEVLCLTAEGRQQDAAQLSVGAFVKPWNTLFAALEAAQATRRAPAWTALAEFVHPVADRFSAGPRGHKAARMLYDSTALVAAEQLAAALCASL